MSDVTMHGGLADIPSPRPHLDAKPHVGGAVAFLCVLVAGLGYAAFSIFRDISEVGEQNLAIGAFVLLGIALLIALGFEFVNGFHDTANAVATVIYTHSLPPLVAVIWSGTFNFLGVLTSSGAVAFTVVTLLPVELILQVGSGAGYAMIFALLIAAIIWNLGTWAMGLPNSSSHALIGSIMGVGLANQFMSPSGSATSGVDWAQAIGVLKALLFSPLIGFVLAAALLLLMKVVVRNKALYTAPEGARPPPMPIRALLVLTCTGVSFFHGSNDGQKGMGLIMLILIGAAPTAYALNRAIPESTTPAFLQAVQEAQGVFQAHATGATPPADAAAARATVGDALKTKTVNTPTVYAALATLTGDIGRQVKDYRRYQDGAGRCHAERPQRHVSGLRRGACHGSQSGRFRRRRGWQDQVVAVLPRQRHQVHPDLGEGFGCARPGPWNHGRLEAHRGDGGREDRQNPSDLCTGRLGRDRGDGDNRTGRRLRLAGFDNPRAVQRRCRYDGRQRLWPAMEHDQEHGSCLGHDIASGNGDRRIALCHHAAGVLNSERSESGLFTERAAATRAVAPGATDRFPIDRWRDPVILPDPFTISPYICNPTLAKCSALPT